MVNFYTRPFYFSDQLANYFRNANYGDSGIRDRIDIILNRQIASWEVLDILFKVIIRINNLRGRYKYRYDDNMMMNLGGSSNIRKALFGTDFTPPGLRIRNGITVDDNISGFQNIDNSSTDGTREFITLRDDEPWGLMYSSIPNLLFYYKISNFWITDELREHFSDPEIILNLSDIHLFLKSVYLIYNQIHFLTGSNILSHDGIIESGIIDDARILYTSSNYNRLKLELEDANLSIENKCIILDDMQFESKRFDYERKQFSEQKGNIYGEFITRFNIANDRYFALYDIVRAYFRQFEAVRQYRQNDVIVPVVNDNEFFVPIIRSCLNVRTPVYWDDTSTQSNFIISYGKLDNYICYGLLELIDGFKPFGENSDFYDYRLYTSEGSFKSLPVEEVLQLKELITSLVPTLTGQNLVQAQELLTVIQDVRDHVKGNTTYERDTYNKFLEFTPTLKNSIIVYLKKFFYVGMYMRQWGGPGFPFPLSGRTTGRESGFNADLHVAPHLEELVGLLERIKELSEDARDFVYNLKEIQHYNGEIRVSPTPSYNLDKLVEITVRGTFCIRMGSTFFIGSGAYYMKLFDNFDFEGYDIMLLDRIH